MTIVEVATDSTVVVGAAARLASVLAVIPSGVEVMPLARPGVTTRPSSPAVHGLCFAHTWSEVVV
jgi:hypothetical protein